MTQSKSFASITLRAQSKFWDRKMAENIAPPRPWRITDKLAHRRLMARWADAVTITTHSQDYHNCGHGEPFGAGADDGRDFSAPYEP